MINISEIQKARMGSKLDSNELYTYYLIQERKREINNPNF